VKGREARGAAERGHEQDAPGRHAPQKGAGRGAGGWRTLRSRGAGELGRRSTVMCGVLKTWHIDGSRAHGPGVGVRVAACNRDGWIPDDGCGRGIEPRVFAGARDRTRTVVEQALEGDNPRRAPAVRSSSGQGEGRAERTPGGSKASKRACRSCTASPVFVGSGRYVRRAFGCGVATGLATARNRRPGSRAGATGESGREEPAGAAPGAVGPSNPQGSRGSRERARLPGEGKLWRGSSRTRVA
jgi:hypothetical protein